MAGIAKLFHVITQSEIAYFTTGRVGEQADDSSWPEVAADKGLWAVEVA